MKNIGNYIVLDSKICHGKPTFKGTRILVEDILDLLEDGISWKKIITECDGKINIEAIREAIHLAAISFVNHNYESSK